MGFYIKISIQKVESFIFIEVGIIDKIFIYVSLSNLTVFLLIKLFEIS